MTYSTVLQVIVASYSGKILSFTAEPVLQRAQVAYKLLVLSFSFLYFPLLSTTFPLLSSTNSLISSVDFSLISFPFSTNFIPSSFLYFAFYLTFYLLSFTPTSAIIPVSWRTYTHTHSTTRNCCNITKHIKQCHVCLWKISYCK